MVLPDSTTPASAQHKTKMVYVFYKALFYVYIFKLNEFITFIRIFIYYYKRFEK